MARRQRGVTRRKDGRWQAKFKVEETGKYKYLYAATECSDYLHLKKVRG